MHEDIIYCDQAMHRLKIFKRTKLLEMLRKLTFDVQFACFYFRPNKGREQLSLLEKETICFFKELLSNFWRNYGQLFWEVLGNL